LEKKDLSCRNANDGMIRVTGAGGTEPYLYALNNNSFITDSIFNQLASGTYTITVRDGHGQKSSVTVSIKNSKTRCSRKSMGLKTKNIIRESLVAKIYPNPTHDQFNIDIESDIDEPIYISVYDVIGNMIFRNQYAPQVNIQLGSGFPAGLYIMQVMQDSITRSYKLVKQ
jgi:hypothetical protein